MSVKLNWMNTLIASLAIDVELYAKKEIDSDEMWDSRLDWMKKKTVKEKVFNVVIINIYD